MLKPDPNRRGVEVSADELDQLNKDPTFQGLRRKGWIAIRTDKPQAEVLAGDGSGPTFDEAQLEALAQAHGSHVKTLINATDDLGLLRAWVDRERRKNALDLLAQRIEQLSPKGDEDGDGDEGTVDL